MAECQDVVDLLYNLLRNKSTTNRRNGVGAYALASAAALVVFRLKCSSDATADV